MGRTIIIGDVHGCLAELQELLSKLELVSDDRLIFVGDIVDRGPDSLGCMRLVQGLGAECLLGNHEEKYLRWHRYETSGGNNPMTSMTPEKLALYKQMDDFDHAWLKSLPPYLELGKHAGAEWIVVHGGLEPNKPLHEQDPRRMVRCRWVSASGRYMKIDMRTTVMKNGDVVLSKPKGGIRWTEAWHRPEVVIYGHAVRSLEGVVCEGNTLGIDTGCVFGGRLTAFVMGQTPMPPMVYIGEKETFPIDPSKWEWADSTHVVQVDARKQYAEVLLDAA